MEKNTLNAKKTRKNGRPFQPGNPGGGRPKQPENIKKAFADLSVHAIDLLRDIVIGVDESAKTADRIRAAEIVLDRHLGKAVQAVDANITDRRPIIFDALFAQVVRPQIEDGNTINHVDADTDESP